MFAYHHPISFEFDTHVDKDHTTLVNWGYLKKNTAPWLKIFLEYIYLLPKHSVKISQEKKMGIFFLFHFL